MGLCVSMGLSNREYVYMRLGWAFACLMGVYTGTSMRGGVL